MASPLQEVERRDFEADELWPELEEVQREMARFGFHERLEVEGEWRSQEDAVGAQLGDSLHPVRYLEQMIPAAAGGIVLEGGFLPQPFSPPGMFADRSLVDEWRFRSDHITRHNYFAPHNLQGAGAGSVPRAAAWPRVLPSNAYVAPPPAWPRRAAAMNSQVEDYILYLAKEKQMVLLDTLLCGSSEDYEAVAKSEHGRCLLGSVLNNNNNGGHGFQDLILARITQDKKRFSKLCVERPDEVVTMIRSCRSWNSFKLLRNAIEPWMAPLILDPNRLRVVQAFMQSVPPDFYKFIFDAVAKNCLALACSQKGVCLLQSCLEHFKGTEKDNILSEISWWSIDLAQNHYGNYIVQDVLKQSDPSYLAIIASCFKNNYVELSRQRYSSNVVETCLEVFDDVERYVIVDELIGYPQFRDLVIDPFANYVIFKALMTCKVLLRNRLATAILCVQNVNRRSSHCLRIFNKLSDLGYIHWKEDKFRSQ